MNNNISETNENTSSDSNTSNLSNNNITYRF